MTTENRIDCPALHNRSKNYPFGDRVPRTVRMFTTVTADPMPGVASALLQGDAPICREGEIFSVWTNSHGAVAAVLPNGKHLGLRPNEFEVETWHNEPKSYPDRLCHIDYTAHPHRCGCLSGDDEAQRRFDEYQRDTKLATAEDEVTRLTAERDALQLRLNSADQRIDELTQRKAEPVEWGAPKTVHQLIRQLETLDQDLRPLSMLRVPGEVFEDGKERIRAVHLSFSHERVDGQWLAPFKGEGEKVLAFWCRMEKDAALSFEFEHPSSKEKRAVTLTKRDVFDGMEDYFYDKLGEQVCQCESVGETNVVDCNCDEYVHDFEVVSACLDVTPASNAPK